MYSMYVDMLVHVGTYVCTGQYVLTESRDDQAKLIQIILWHTHTVPTSLGSGNTKQYPTYYRTYIPTVPTYLPSR